MYFDIMYFIKNYFKNRKYVKKNKGKILYLSFIKIRIEGWDWITGKIIVQVINKNHTKGYYSTLDYNQVF